MQKSQIPEREGRKTKPLLDLVDAVIAGIIIAGCSFLYYATTTFEETSALLGDNIQPEDFPRIMLVIIGGLALLLPFEHSFSPDGWNRIKEDRGKHIPLVTTLTTVLLVVVVVISPYLGMVLTIFGISALMPLLWGDRRYWLVGIFSILFTVSVTYIFSVLLQVYFEPGIFNISLR